MKVLLVDPPGRSAGLNIGLAYIAASLKRENHTVKVCDLNNFDHNKWATKTKSHISNFKPDVIGFSILSYDLQHTLRIIKEAKSLISSPIVVGGVHVTAIERANILRRNFINFAVIGEGEITMTELTKAIEEGGDFSKVPGLAYRLDNDIIVNPERPLVKDLDSLPFPDYSSFGIKKMGTYPLLTSRGCPYSCIFCLSPKLCGRRWRARRPEAIIEELKVARYLYNSSRFRVFDDNFTLDTRRAKEFCDLLIASGLRFGWTCDGGIRADRVDEELAEKMKLAGCDSVYLGIESLHPAVFNSVNKGETLEDIKETIKLFRKVGIPVHGFLIIGLPNDTFERTLFSIENAKNIGLTTAAWQHLIPLPRTEAYSWATTNGRIYYKCSDRWPTNAVFFDTPDFTKKERELAYIIANVKCQNYGGLYRFDRSYLWNFLNIAANVLRYDFAHLFSHLSKMVNISLKLLSSKIGWRYTVQASPSYRVEYAN